MAWYDDYLKCPQLTGLYYYDHEESELHNVYHTVIEVPKGLRWYSYIKKNDMFKQIAKKYEINEIRAQDLYPEGFI